MADAPVTAAVDMSATGGLDALGNWHDTDGRFQKRGVSTAKAAAVRALRGLAAAALAKDRPDGVDLDLGDHSLAAKVGHRPRVRWHDDRHGIVEHNGRKVLVPWDAFEDPAPQRSPDWAKLSGRADATATLDPAPPGRSFHRLTVSAPPETGPLGLPIPGTGADITRISWHPDTGRVEALQTEGPFQRRGLATAVFDEATRLAHEHGLTPPRHDTSALTDDGAAWAAAETARHRDKERADVFRPDIARLGVADWETTKPWEHNEADIDAGRAPGWLQRLRGSRNAHASYEHSDGQVYLRVSPSYWDSPPESRRAALYHEAGHILDAMLPAAVKQAAYDDLLDGANFAPSRDNPDEMVAESYALLNTNPQWLIDHQPKLHRWIIDQADLHGMPVPDAARTVEPRQVDVIRGGSEFPAARVADLPVGAEFEDRVGVRYTRTVDGAVGRSGDMPLGYFTGDTPGGYPPGAEFTAYGDIETAQRNDLPDRTGPPPEPVADALARKDVKWAARHLFNHDLGGGYRSEVDSSQYSDDPGSRGGEPARRVLSVTGTIIAPDGSKAGSFARTVSQAQTADGWGDPEVYHGFLRLGRRHMGHGVGTRFTAKSEAAYRRDGITRIRTTALSDPEDHHNGGYVWARAGFDWSTDVSARRVGQRLLDIDPNHPLGRRLTSDDPLDEKPTPNDVAVDPVGKQVLLGNISWGGVKRLTPPSQSNDLTEWAVAVAEPPVPPWLDTARADARLAIDRLFDIHHEDVGINGFDLPTLPTLAVAERWRGQALPPDTQQFALQTLFRPDVAPGDLYFAPLPILDDTPANAGSPIRAVAVNAETGEIVGTHAEWVPGPDGRPTGPGWVSLPADDPMAADLVTAAWLASAPVKRYLTEQLLPRLRGGYPVDDTFPALNEAAAHAAEIAARYLDDVDIPVRRVTDLDGTYYVPDPDGRYRVDGESIHFADFDPDGGTRLWVHPDAVSVDDTTAALDAIDYSTVDNPDVAWTDRVAALADIRRQLTATYGTPSELFTKPTEADLDDLLRGYGGDTEFRHLAVLTRFGESLEALIEERRAQVAAQPDKRAVLDRLAAIGGVPPPLATLLASEDWDATVVGHVVNPTAERPHGGGSVAVTFPGHPDSQVRVFTSARTGTTTVAWEFDGRHQIALGRDAFSGWSPSGAVTVDAAAAPADWYDSLRTGPASILRTGDNTPTMIAWLDTMEALGVDMGTDESFLIGDGTGGGTGRLADRGDDLIARTARIGLRPYPKAWTSTLHAKPVRLDIDATRDRPVGTSTDAWDHTYLNVPSVDAHGDYADVVTHEFAHAFERGVDGLMLIETWHFIQRLRAEMRTRDREAVEDPSIPWWDHLRQWQWDDTFYGFRDYFGDEYMGRVYSNHTTGVTGVTAMAGLEIFSTASQALWGHAPSRGSAFGADPPSQRLLTALMAVVEPRKARR